jgi:predicted permease
MWRRHRSDADFSAEIESHISAEIDRLVDEGFSPEDARSAAYRRFGNVAITRERFYESKRIVWFDSLLQDVRAAARSIAKYPVTTTIAILSLAGGIGSTAAMLMVRDAIFVKPPPLYHQPELLATIGIATPQRPGGLPHAQLYLKWAQSPDLQPGIAAAAASDSDVDVRIENRLETVDVRPVTPSLFDLLGVFPAIGRTFASGVPGAVSETQSVILDHRIWKTLFDGRPDILGQTVWMAERPYSVIGVMPERFWFADMGPTIWTTLDPEGLAPDQSLRVVFRRTPALSRAALEARLQRDVDAYAAGLPEAERQMRTRVRDIRGTPMAEQMALAIPWILATAVVLTLIIACANVAILVFAQWTAREREIALRASLGASRGRIVRLLVTESVAVAILGGVLGTAAAFALRGLILRNSGPAVALFDLAIEPALLIRTAVITILAGILAGVGPALIETHRLHANPLRALTSERVRQRWRHALVVVEITVTVALLVVASALLDGYRRTFSTDLGFSTRRLLTARVENPDGVPIGTIVNIINRVPGVALSAAGSTAPVAGVGPHQVVSADAAGSNPVVAERVSIGEGFFETLGVSLRSGRQFTGAEADAAIINETLARRLFPQGSPVGRQIWIAGQRREIVGLVADHATVALRRFTPGVYVPLSSSENPRRMQFLVRAMDNPSAMVTAVRRAITTAAPGTKVTSAFALDDIIAVGAQEVLVTTYPLFPLIGMGLFLTGAGIYGVLAFAITRRSSELAVRSAIGASGYHLVRLVAGHSVRLVAIGSGLAVAATFALTRFVRSAGGAGTVFDTPGWYAFAAPVLIVTTVVALATWIPSRRVMRINAARLLRVE